jgi:hypothetical protein
MAQLSRYVDLYSVSYTTTAGTLEVDTQDCEGVMFLAVPATTVARIISLALKAGATTTGFVNCASTFTHASSAAGNIVVCTDVYKPAKRWIGATVSSSASSANWIFAFKYGLRAPLTAGFTAGTTASYMSPATAGVLRVISPTSSS